jgi:hypothetical protein
MDRGDLDVYVMIFVPKSTIRNPKSAILRRAGTFRPKITLNTYDDNRIAAMQSMLFMRQ